MHASCNADQSVGMTCYIIWTFVGCCLCEQNCFVTLKQSSIDVDYIELCSNNKKKKKKKKKELSMIV